MCGVYCSCLSFSSDSMLKCLGLGTYSLNLKGPGLSLGLEGWGLFCPWLHHWLRKMGWPWNDVEKVTQGHWKWYHLFPCIRLQDTYQKNIIFYTPLHLLLPLGGACRNTAKPFVMLGLLWDVSVARLLNICATGTAWWGLLWQSCDRWSTRPQNFINDIKVHPLFPPSTTAPPVFFFSITMICFQ